MPKQQSFTTWLQTHSKDRTAIGDLARDVSADPGWPSGKGLSGQRAYLEDLGAIPAAIDTLERAWEAYTAHRAAEDTRA
ncbi:YozE family protein [Streptomyces sp. NPDC051109]|uniref:YozE family protein n=1 Tax=Streptomyces sp. NPDC051109 TaxID=3365642 RepID=UPI001067146A